MSHVPFKTGKAYQEETAIWARQRLADKRGRCFVTPDDQDGVLFADSVGLGKTWEALSAAALILYKEKPKKGRRHILILCPANLVTKWEDELAARSPFREKLNAWARRLKKTGQAAPAQRVLETLTQVFPIRSARDVQTQKKYGKFHPPPGTYIVSQSLITGQARKLIALRREEWDIIIVDEAHNATARKALVKLQEGRRARTKLLLTATPFQLEPRQWNSLARNLLKRSQKVLSQPDVASYIELLAQVFESPEKPGPKPKSVEAASKILRKLAARSVPRSSNRRYEMLMLDGTSNSLRGRLDELGDSAVARVLNTLRHENEEARDLKFELAYFEERLRLATSKQQTFVATRLRRLLAAGTSAQESPRRRALVTWARKNFQQDLQGAMETGLPRKALLFTAWVGEANGGEAAALKTLLAEAFADALAAVKRHFGRNWSGWTDTGRRRLEKKAAGTSTKVADALSALRDDDLTSALAGKHRRFASRVSRELQKRAAAIQDARDEVSNLVDRRSFEARALKRRIRDMEAALSPWTTGPPLGAVERYTGSERRTARDRAATAFREVGPPWVLVASNVGSEGIDLHTYTARIIHYDLEWNPAKMEQREGRGDRVGRRLQDKLAILYCLVPRTYDERMFYQLVARDRWHGVLLGKPASRLDDDQVDVLLIDRKRIARMRLDLAPPKSR
jgi:superfamily II DNA or RNA helicase